ALEARRRVRGHALAVHHQLVAVAPLEITLRLLLVRRVCGARRGRRQEPRHQERRHPLPPHRATSEDRPSAAMAFVPTARRNRGRSVPSPLTSPPGSARGPARPPEPQGRRNPAPPL